MAFSISKYLSEYHEYHPNTLMECLDSFIMFNKVPIDVLIQKRSMPKVYKYLGGIGSFRLWQFEHFYSNSAHLMQHPKVSLMNVHYTPM